MKRSPVDAWIERPQADVWLSLAAGLLFLLYTRFSVSEEFVPADVAATLAGVAGTVLGMFGVVFGLLGNEGGRRVKSIVQAHAETVDRNWRSVLMLPGLALAASLVVVMFTSLCSCLAAALLGFSATAVALSGLRMGWFVSMTFRVNEVESQEVKAEMDPDF